MERWFSKVSAAVGSGVPDTSTAALASTAPVPQTAFENKPPPGQRGPRGLSGRQTFSRVNTGLPPTPDAGQRAQKSVAPRGMEFLPKFAHLENPMTTSAMPRPSLQDFIKTAMVSSAAKVDLSLEGARQLANSGDTPPSEGTEKVASTEPEEVTTEYAEKLANAIDYVAASINPKLAQPGDTTTNAGPGKGPQSLETNQGKLPTEDNIDANQTGEATQKPPMNPGTQKLPGQKGDPGGTMETNESMSHPEQPTEPISNEKTTVSNEGVKAAEAAYARNLVELGLLKVAHDEQGQVQLVPANELVKEALVSEMGQYAGSGIGGAIGGGAGGAVKGGLMGGLGGGALGGIGGALAGGMVGGLPGALAGGALGAGAGGLAGSTGGALLGGGVGSVAGGVKGMRRAYAGGQALKKQQAAAAAAQMPKAAEIDLEILKKNLQHLGLNKQAEDAISPASVSAGKADATGAEPPKGAAPAEQGVPSEPSDVNAQKQKMLSSNEAAINYTKRDAKADPKGDLKDVLKEPAQTKSTDKVLQNVLDNDGGNKISSVTRVASARAILSKLAAEMNGKGKKKESQGMPAMSAPTTPQEAAGPAARSATM